MNRKEAHNRKDKWSLYGRNTATQWYLDYTAEQMTWLWDHEHIMWSKPMYHLGETDREKYIQFTDKGREWFDWYSLTFGQYLKYKVFRWVDIKCAWQRFRIKCGHRYAWQEYDYV